LRITTLIFGFIISACHGDVITLISVMLNSLIIGDIWRIFFEILIIVKTIFHKIIVFIDVLNFVNIVGVMNSRIYL